MIDKRAMLEIGAGLGTVGISLALLGHQVVVSDREPALLQTMQDNIDANACQRTCKVLNLDWAKGAESPKMRTLLSRQNFGCLIGADVIYSPEMCDLIVRLLPIVLPKGGHGLFVNPIKHRNGAEVRKKLVHTNENKISCA
jgi:predicted nicotinamide N-methyase